MKHLKIAAFALVAALAKYAIIDKALPGPHQFVGVILCAAIFALGIEGILFLRSTSSPTAGKPRKSGWMHTLLILGMVALFGLTGLLGTALRVMKPILHFHPLAVAAGIVAGAVWFATAWRIYKWLYPHMQIDVQLPLSITSPILVILMAAMAGFFEELIFRGFLLFMWGIWVSSLAFAALHIYPNISKIPRTKRQAFGAIFYLTKLVVAGLVYSAIVLHFRSLWPAIAAHTTVDLIGMTMLWRKQRAQVQTASNTSNS